METPAPAPSGTPWPPRDAALAAAEVGVLAAILALALGGNVLVLVALRPPRARGGAGGCPRPAPPLRRYLRHLSVADLGVAGGQVLPQLLWDVTDRFRGPDLLCRLTKYLQGVAMFASAYVAVAMAYDRHRAICRPLGAQRRRKGAKRGGGEGGGCWRDGDGGNVAGAQGRRDTWDGTWEPAGGWEQGRDNGTAASSQGPPGTPPTPSVTTRSLSPPPSPQVAAGGSWDTMGESQVTVGESKAAEGGSQATTEGSWATMGTSKATEGGSQATVDGSLATTGGLQATKDGSKATEDGSKASEGGSQPRPAQPWAPTRWIQVALSQSRGHLRSQSGSGPLGTCRWAQVATSRARAGVRRLGWIWGRARRRWGPLATAWTLALLFGLPQVGIFARREVGPGEEDCWATFIQPWGARAYVTWVALAVLVAPAALLGGLQVAVTRELAPGGRRVGLARARAKSHRMAMVVLGVYVGCWAPFFCAQLWAVWDPRAPVEGPAFTILMLLANLNSCTNPWIYAAFSTSLSRAMGRILCPCRRHTAPP
ncbi:uncharacterized protein LOC133629036 [Colius striatus]|uniref:uncharacterized protein LOC133629036 n=1 Tax=Colius striatus TaxID=57412 RepID=UPI002B1D629A|nr:uncharacterized protein LOC133629036 [Colius striatus]